MIGFSLGLLFFIVLCFHFKKNWSVQTVVVRGGKRIQRSFDML